MPLLTQQQENVSLSTGVAAAGTYRNNWLWIAKSRIPFYAAVRKCEKERKILTNGLVCAEESLCLN